MRGLVVLALALAPTRADADADESFDAATMAMQTGGGTVAAVVGGVLVGGVVYAGSAPFAQGMSALALSALGGVVGCSAGLIVATKLIGDWRGGTGSWLGTSAGFGAGLLAAGAVAALADNASLGVRIVIGATLLGVAPTIGYQLTNDGATPPAMMFALPAVRF